MEDTLRIEPMTASDWPEVAAIYTQAIENGGASVLDECPPFEEWDKKHYPNLRYVMRDKDKVVGWCALSPFSERHAYRGVAEGSLYIDKAYHRSGIGKDLILYLIEQSEIAGIWTIYSKTFADNMASRKLQENVGFRLVGIHEKLGHDRFGVFHDIAVYERRSHKVEYPNEQ